MQLETFSGNDHQAHLATPEHSIHLVSAEMVAEGGPVYNYIVFRDHTGQGRVMMNGLVLERQKSDIRALRGVMAPPMQGGLPGNYFNELSSIEIFSGDVGDYLYKMNEAIKALKFINEQNLSYEPEKQTSDSPNSIAYALVEAMELDYPDEARQFWAPGQDNKLLPKDWRH